MYQNFKEIEKRAIELGPKKVAVLFPDDLDVLRSVIDGNRKGLIHPVLIGNRNRIEKVAAQKNLSLNIAGCISIAAPIFSFKVIIKHRLGKMAVEAARKISKGMGQILEGEQYNIKMLSENLQSV